MWLEWECIDDDDDSKFAKFEDLLKHELFKKDRNPEGKIVVFSEAVDTIEYNRPKQSFMKAAVSLFLATAFLFAKQPKMCSHLQ